MIRWIGIGRKKNEAVLLNQDTRWIISSRTCDLIWEMKTARTKEFKSMLNRKSIVVAAAIAMMGIGSQAGAYTIDLQPAGGDLGTVPSSTVVVLTNTYTVTGGEAFLGWDWSLQCTGCTMVGYNFNYAFANLVQWAPGVYVAANVDPPSQLDGPNTFTQIGSFSGTTNAGAGTITVGWVTLHITGTGGASPYLRLGEGMSDGAGLAAPSALGGVSWTVPEPGTAMLLALGLSGLGLMGRRNR